MEKSYEVLQSILIVKKLTKQKEFDSLENKNKTEIALWEVYYPEHFRWIQTLIKDLKENRRIAFGVVVFYNNREHLLGSVVLKKDAYAPSIEFKNLIFYDENLKLLQPLFHSILQKHSLLIGDLSVELRDLVYRLLINKVNAFSESRGIKRTFSELPLEKKDEINSLLDNGYRIRGMISPKYRESDDLVLLTKELISSVPVDPFDYNHLSDQIIKSYTAADTSFLSPIKIKNSKGHDITIIKKEFNLGRPDQEGVAGRFNFKCLLLVVSDRLAQEIDAQAIDDLNLSNDIESYFRIFVFDFASKTTLKRKIEHLSEKFMYFNYDELQKLLGGEFYIKRRAITGEDVGGLLVFADHSESFITKTKEEKFKKFGFFLLGSIGKSLNKRSIVLFADVKYDKSMEEKKLKIWGMAVTDEPLYISFERTGDMTVSEYVFSHFFIPIDNPDTGKPEQLRTLETLWDQPEFNTHNQYNALKETVVLPLTGFTQSSASLPVETKQFISGLDEEIVRWHYNEKFSCLYLSEGEIRAFLSTLPAKVQKKFRTLLGNEN